MGRIIPAECEHGRIFDWGDFGDENSKPERCKECEAREKADQWWEEEE